MEKLKFIKNIEGDTATMLLYSPIGDSVDANGNLVYGINGQSFANELTYLADKYSTINIRINSTGGSVIDGYSIISAILNCKATVNTFIDGLAASTAGWIALCGKNVSMADYGRFMLHNPSGGEYEKVFNAIKDTIVTVISNRTSLTKEEVSNMMDKETWLDSKECLEKNFINKIISSEKKISVKKTNSLAELATIYNQLITKQMIKVTNTLKLSNDANEDSIVSAIDILKAENEALKAQIADYNAEKLAAENSAKEALKTKAVTLVTNAVKEGKILETEKETTIENASKDEKSFEFVSGILSKISNNKQSKKPFDFSKIENKGTIEDRSTWTYKDWESKDLKGLTNMYLENKEQYNELIKTIKK